MSDNQSQSIGISGQSKNPRKKDLRGMRFTRLVVIEEAGTAKSGNLKWRCLCDCGKEIITVGSWLLNGDTKSCGCYSRQLMKAKSTTHGLSKHPLHSIWTNILSRCYNENVTAYKDYGGRGVVMCDEWKNDFKVFYDWAIENGWSEGLEIDKDIKATELGVEPLLYSPARCQFVTGKINSRSRRNNTLITVNGETAAIAEFAERYGVKAYNISQRIIKLGWTAEEAVLGKNKK
jgi:hypothetical protein